MDNIMPHLNREIDPWFKEGKEEGIEIGIHKKDFVFVLNLITNTDFDDAKIANLAAVSEEFVKEIRLKYSKD